MAHSFVASKVRSRDNRIEIDLVRSGKTPLVARIRYYRDYYNFLIFHCPGSSPQAGPKGTWTHFGDGSRNITPRHASVLVLNSLDFDQANALGLSALS